MVDDQFDAANAATDALVEAFVSEIGRMFSKWEAVAPSYIVERALTRPATDLSNLTDDLKTVAGPATSKLLDALVAYRDSRPEDR